MMDIDEVLAAADPARGIGACDWQSDEAERLYQRIIQDSPPRRARSGRPVPATRGGKRRAPWRSRIAAPLAAAAAVTAVAVGVTTLSPLGGGNGPGASLPVGVPRFYVVTYGSLRSPEIRSTATGQLTGTLRVPHGYGITTVAPAGSDYSYVAAVQLPNGEVGPDRLEQFSIGRNGQPSALRPLGIKVPFRIPGLAVTPTTIGVFAFRSYKDRQWTQVEVINRHTRQARAWTGCYCVALDWSYPFTFSLSANGRLLAGSPLNGTEYGVFGVRLLPTASRPGSYTAHSRLVLPDAYWATLSPSGSTLYACLSHPGLHLSTWVAYSVATGRKRTIARWRGAQYGDGGGCQAVASASRRYLLVHLGGNNERAEVLDLRTGRVIPIDHGHFGGANGDFYW